MKSNVGLHSSEFETFIDDKKALFVMLRSFFGVLTFSNCANSIEPKSEIVTIKSIHQIFPCLVLVFTNLSLFLSLNHL